MDIAEGQEGQDGARQENLESKIRDCLEHLTYADTQTLVCLLGSKPQLLGGDAHEKREKNIQTVCTILKDSPNKTKVALEFLIKPTFAHQTTYQPDTDDDASVKSKVDSVLGVLDVLYNDMANECMNEITTSDGDTEDEPCNEKTLQSVAKKQRPSDFKLLYEKQPFSTKGIQTKHQTRLLEAICKKAYLPVIEHFYTKAYLASCWRHDVWFFAIPCLLIYFVLVGSLTFNVASHFKDPQFGNVSKNLSTEMITEIPVSFQKLAQWTMLVSSILLMIFEGIQMIAKRVHYWKQASNYADIVVTIGSLAVSVIGMHNFSPEIYQFGVMVMCIGWINAAWMLTKLWVGPFGWFRRRFIIIFHVMRSIIIFLPVFGFFIFIMALTFNSLLHNQESFSNLGTSIMRSLAFTIGELDFSAIFFAENVSEQAQFVVLTNIIFVLFIGIMNIAIMNILVGLAVGDIQELQTNSRVYAFESSVDLSMECQVTMEWIRLHFKKSCCSEGTANTNPESNPLSARKQNGD